MTSNSHALCLLSTYNSDSDSEDEIESQPILVKRLLEEYNETPSKKLKSESRYLVTNMFKKHIYHFNFFSTRLPLPSIFSSSTVNVDVLHPNQSDLHKGRIRTFAHERGNWATYVYVPCNDYILI